MLRAQPLVLVGGAVVCLVTLGLLYTSADSLPPILPLCKSPAPASESPAPASDYHALLSSIRPLDKLEHSPTLAVFTDIFVISLKRRDDRRKEMDKLKAALRLDWTYVYATEAADPLVTRVLEHVRATRAVSNASAFAWPTLTPAGLESEDAFPRADADLWELDPADPRAPPPLPPPPSPDTRPPLECFTGNYSKPDPRHSLVLNAPRVATWASHLGVIRRIAEQPRADYVGLVLEDDVDLEWDIERRVRAMWPALPPDWDMVMVGHCWTPETQNKALPHAPHLHPSSSPLCTHAYAVSRNGARRLVTQMRYPMFAYGRALDNAFQHLMYSKRIKSFSIAPPIAVQRRDNWSDIWEGKENGPMDYLVDSTLERIHLVEAAQTADRT